MSDIEEIKKVEREEEKILVEEKKMAKEEGKLLNETIDLQKTFKDATKMRMSFLRKFAKHKFLFSLIGGIGVVLVWRGLWDLSETIPGLESSAVALVVGLGIIWLLEKYTEL